MLKLRKSEQMTGDTYKRHLLSDYIVHVFLVGVLVVTLTGCATSAWHDYSDPDGNSSIASYQIGSDYVSVRFTDGSIYTYTDASAGEQNIERMKDLARTGDGLNSFILANVTYDYESRSR